MPYVHQDHRGLIPRGIVVSCQAPDDHPLRDSAIMAALARCAETGGAIALRVNGPVDIRAVRQVSKLPILGLHKIKPSTDYVYITPTFALARELAAAGADVIAIDATARERPGGVTAAMLIARIHDELGLPVMADIATLDEGLAAAAAGADIVATTLNGYTRETALADPAAAPPNLDLLAELARLVDVPVIMEGRIQTPEQAAAALACGAHAVVIGKAITDPLALTCRFVRAVSG